MTLFTIKYAPKQSKQIFGQDSAVAQLRDFIINYKRQKNKAALLYGPIGTGKTASVHALAKELKYDLLELNASDFRDAESIKTFLDNSLGQQSLFFIPKMVLIDEIDALSGHDDRGCLPALLRAMEKSIYPIILTANDPFDSKFNALRKECFLIPFLKIEYRAIAHTLLWVCEQEGIMTELSAINTLARQADGDLRAALLDLQVCVTGKNVTLTEVTNLADRKRTQSILAALAIVFKSSSVENALPALNDVDVEMNEIFLWLDENIPREYRTAAVLSRAYEALARADVFQGRIRRQQHWRFLVYIQNLLTAGISTAKDEKNTTYVEYKRTMRLLRIWQSNQKKVRKKEIARKMAAATHTSFRRGFQCLPHLLPALQRVPSVAQELGLTEEEKEWLKKEGNS